MRRLVLTTVLVAALASTALSGCGSDDKPEAEARPLRRCEVDSTGLTFRTSLGTCTAAIAKGVDLSVDAGFVSDPDAVAAGAAFAALCEIIQGKEVIPYDDEDGIRLARQLHRTGVCPGKVANLDPDP